MKKIIILAVMLAWVFTACSKSGNVTVDFPLQYPTTPSYIAPANNATNLSKVLTLSWHESKDPQGDPVFYDVIVSPSTELNFLGYYSLNLTEPTTSINLTGGNYDNYNDFYWQVTAKDNHNNVSAGPIWHFIVAGQK